MNPKYKSRSGWPAGTHRRGDLRCGGPDGVTVRIVGDDCPTYDGTQSVKPTLEDLYLYSFADDEDSL